MSLDPKARTNLGDYGTELGIANALDHICNLPVDPCLDRLNEFKEQIQALFLRLQRGELSDSDAKAQSLRIQEELSMLIWSLEDWQIQFMSRN
jgi:hypothetical protein